MPHPSLLPLLLSLPPNKIMEVLANWIYGREGEREEREKSEDRRPTRNKEKGQIL